MLNWLASVVLEAARPPPSDCPDTILFQLSWVPAMIFSANSLFFGSALNANSLAGFPSGILYILNHSTVALRKPGMILSTSWMSFRFSARGSLTSIAITFQSVSPSSIIANTPRTLTLRTVPLEWIVDPISQTSIGSLSPLQLVDGSVWLGSSQV